MSILSRIYFALSLFFFLYVSQGDVVTAFFSGLSGRPAPDLSWLVALVVTVVALWSSRWLSKHCQAWLLPPMLPYMVWAWGVTAWVSVPFGSLAHQLVLLVVAVCGMFAETAWWRRHSAERKGGGIWKQFMPPTVSLLLMSLFMGIGAATTDVEHHELRTAACLLGGHPKRALKVGHKSLATSRRLVALRAYAMASKPGHLADELFAQPFPSSVGSSLLLFPEDGKQSWIFPADSLAAKLGDRKRDGENALDYFARCAEKAGRRPSVAADYYLCGLLLDRRIDDFAREYPRFYGRLGQCRHVPHYYAEALVMYARLRTRPVIIHRDAAIEANLKDYSDMGDSIADPRVRRNLLRRSYGDTYWWCYNYAGRK